VPGDAVTATGRVERETPDGAPSLAVDDPAGIALVGGLEASGAGPSADPGSFAPGSRPAGDGTAPDQPGGSPVTAGLVGGAMPELGALGLILVATASAAVTLLRRQRLRRRLATRIAARLAAIAGAASPLGVATATATPVAAGSGLGSAAHPFGLRSAPPAGPHRDARPASRGAADGPAATPFPDRAPADRGPERP